MYVCVETLFPLKVCLSFIGVPSIRIPESWQIRAGSCQVGSAQCTVHRQVGHQLSPSLGDQDFSLVFQNNISALCLCAEQKSNYTVLLVALLLKVG